MPRAKSYSRSQIAAAALPHFWEHGPSGVTIDQIVSLTGVSRHALYSEIGGKEELYLSVFDAYQQSVVAPAFRAVEEGGGLESIAAYFFYQIDLAERKGLPGPGCLVGNAAVERAPHDKAVAALVDAHNKRLREGFLHALSTEKKATLSAAERRGLAAYLVVSAQGLWSVSRTVHDAEPLRRFVRTMMALIEARMTQ